ncbi:MAG: alpha-glucosidase [Lachnospiraceae bacterium]|nr:alpha-glucosidase [Lachnospiraceae bacterium]MBR6958506.1 alpha-glucosidase [Erysipelotrichaceae bacterium]
MNQTVNDRWWKDSVIYQIYPRSFQDSNGDGIGDIPGIISRLDYLKDLGIDAIWICPVYRSPQDDCGYDISDYQDIDPMFGTLRDMDDLIREAKKRGIGIIMDLVLNHTSDEHPWFREARKSRDNPYHDYYVWRDGTKDVPPNDLKASFGGSAWEWAEEAGQYYFHQFSVKQPDLNWNNPMVRQEIYRMIRWWMERGVCGFRLDVIDQIAKEPDKKILANGPRLHEYLQEMTRETFSRGDLITVGEAWGADIESAKKFSSPDGKELSMVFQFWHTLADQQIGKTKWDLAPLNFRMLKDIMARWQEGLYREGWNSLFWNNHDLPRVVSHLGNDGPYRAESAKMLAMVLHGMQGTPYIYQGEEIGMTNAPYDIEDYRDIELLNAYRERIREGIPEDEVMRSIHAKGRDNARTPMQWDDSRCAGFTEGEPWIKVNPNYSEINVKAALADPDSVYYCYRKLIALRKEYPVFKDGSFTLLMPDSEDLFVYIRETDDEKMLVAANFFGREIKWDLPEEWKKGKILLHNYDDMKDGMLRPYEAFMTYLGER